MRHEGGRKPNETYYGHVPDGFTIIRIGFREVVRQERDQNWRRLFGDGHPSDFRHMIDAMVEGRGYRLFGRAYPGSRVVTSRASTYRNQKGGL